MNNSTEHPTQRPPEHPEAGTFTDRLRALEQSTGLNAGQLGVARCYEQPHEQQNGDAQRRIGSHVGVLNGEHLAGEEVLVKDTQQVAGEWVTMGNAGQGFRATHSDTAVEALLASGARLVGASASAEYGTTAYTEPVGQPEPVNPISPAFMTGGSSGGAAVAVARGLVRIAHATDGGGSIRVPAACCGLLGLKPAHDTSIGSFNPSAHGYLASSVALTRKAYQLDVVAPKGLRVGYTNQPFHHHSQVDPQIAAATAAVTGMLSSRPAVAEVTRAPAPYDPTSFEAFSSVLAARCADLPEPLTALTGWLKAQGAGVPDWHREALEGSIHAMRDAAFNRWSGADLDVVATPMLACAPPAPGAFSALPPRQNFWAQTAWTPWATLWNICGWASVSVPLVAPEKVPGRWPIALQLGAVGDRVSAAELVALAEEVQLLAGRLDPLDLSIAEPGKIYSLYADTRMPEGAELR